MSAPVTARISSLKLLEWQETHLYISFTSKYVLFNVEYFDVIKRNCFNANDYQLKKYLLLFIVMGNFIVHSFMFETETKQHCLNPSQVLTGYCTEWLLHRVKVTQIALYLLVPETDSALLMIAMWKVRNVAPQPFPN